MKHAQKMTKGNVKESNATPTTDISGISEQGAGPDHFRRATALKKMIDIKKSYDFWQELVNKNVRQKLKKRRSSDGNEVHESNSRHNLVAERALEDDGESTINDAISNEAHDFFSEHDLKFLRRRLDEIVSQNGIQLKDGEVDRLLESCVVEAKINQGFDPYGNDDEEGLHDGNSGQHEDGLDVQEDYDVDELHDEDDFSYDYPSRHHHFEVELSDGPPGSGPLDENEPSCEFTFEYDCDGKLIPTSNNIEEKLRLMNLQSQITNEALSLALALAMAIALAAGGKKKKKNQKKKKKTKADEDHGACNEPGSNLCLFCQYEAFYGVKPAYSMKRQDYTHKWEMERRMKIREKLESAKLARHEQGRWNRQNTNVDLDDSHGTVEDD